MSYLQDGKVDIACLQETWLRSSDKSTYQIMQEFGYKTIKKERLHNKGGGLVVAYKPELGLKRLCLYCR